MNDIVHICGMNQPNKCTISGEQLDEQNASLVEDQEEEKFKGDKEQLQQILTEVTDESVVTMDTEAMGAESFLVNADECLTVEEQEVAVEEVVAEGQDEVFDGAGAPSASDNEQMPGKGEQVVREEEGEERLNAATVTVAGEDATGEGKISEEDAVEMTAKEEKVDGEQREAEEKENEKPAEEEEKATKCPPDKSPPKSPQADGYSAPLVLVHGQCASIDVCPGCDRKLDPVRGGYSVNCVTFDVTLSCVTCGRSILIRGSFNASMRKSLLSR